jgi:hypothetical protein
MKTVIYHSADYDGIFCREIAWKFLGPKEGEESDCRLIGWNFGDPLIEVPAQGEIYILDLSPECLVGSGTGFDVSRLIWIDHHKTSIEKFDSRINGYRIDGVAACRLTWQWLGQSGAHAVSIGHGYILPEKQDFLDRKVTEPLAVRLAGEYDIWDKRDPRAETFQYALRCSNQPDESFQSLLQDDSPTEQLIGEMLKLGEAAQHYAQRTDASVCKYRTWLMEWEGFKFLCVNSARFNSLFFASRDLPETGHDALLGFCYDGKCWTVSLYHAKHRTDLDLSVIAKKYGGGGHRGACGFTTQKLPFL